MPNISDFYSKLLDIYRDSSLSSREQLFSFFATYIEFLRHFIPNNTTSFTEYAFFYYALKQAKFPSPLNKQIISFRRYIQHLKRSPDLMPTAQIVDISICILSKSLAFVTNTELPAELLFVDNIWIKKSNNNTNCFITDSYATPYKTNALEEVKLTYISKTTLGETVTVICRDNDDTTFVISIAPSQLDMLRPAWQYCLICFTNIVRISTTGLDAKQENLSFSDALFFQTLDNSQIIVEPNFLVDVTDITDCFSLKYQFPIIPIASKFLSRGAGVSAFIGNIVNTFFDELIYNIEIDFDTALSNALQNKPLQLLEIVKQNTIYENNISLFFEKHRTELYDYFNNLRNIILQNNWTNSNPSTVHNRLDNSELDNNVSANNCSFFVEPTFISSKFGLQGRLDLMIEKSSNTTTTIDIIELKSNKAPSKNLVVHIGINDKRKFILPLWIPHYIQIVCYNMLLQNRYIDKVVEPGNSAIFYSKPNEINPIRAVVDNFFIQNEILIMRNWVVRYLRELAIGNMSILTELSEDEINKFPVYLINNINEMLGTLNNLNELEQMYFTYHIAFIIKEMFAQKTGSFSNVTNLKIGSYGFSALWRLNLEEKLSNNLLLPNLSIDYNASNFVNMHLQFNMDKDADTLATAFRKGDICILYSTNNSSDNNDASPLNNQLFRGKIVEINENYVVVSLRNKLNRDKFIIGNNWCLEADYIEVNNRYLLSSISDFILNNSVNKQYILGAKQPRFITNENTILAVNNIENLNAEQKNIIQQALSAQNYYLIQGPPGTGKTSFILRYLAQILFSNTVECVLFLAYTNRAVDEICSSLKKIEKIYPNFDFIRLGNKDSSQHIDKLLSHFSVFDLPEKINKCRFFVATITTANASPELFKIKNFDTIIVDEAAQILEAHIVGILSKSKRFIMIGDEKQLPPVSVITENKLNIGEELLHSIEVNSPTISLFERLLQICIKNNYPAFSLLHLQSRMSPQIMQLANNLFYNDQLKINDKLLQVQPLNIINANHDCLYIDTPVDKNPKVNHIQVEIILKLIQKIKQSYLVDFNRDIDETTIGIISPWRLQCNAILNMLSASERQIITVDTVERFQGSERDIIIFSVPTNSTYFLDLLSNTKIINNMPIDRKLNVAITRAKKKFILIGNYAILSQNVIYNKLISLLKWIDFSNFN